MFLNCFDKKQSSIERNFIPIKFNRKFTDALCIEITFSMKQLLREKLFPINVFLSSKRIILYRNQIDINHVYKKTTNRFSIENVSITVIHFGRFIAYKSYEQFSDNVHMEKLSSKRTFNAKVNVCHHFV